MPNASATIARPLRTAWVAIALLVCGLAVYGNALPNPFLIDDKYVVLNDPRVQTCDVRTIFTQEYWPGVVGNRLYRPLTTLSLAVNWAVSHELWTFRLVNLLLHVLTGLGLYLLARDVTRSVFVACAAALLFVVHPIHTTPLNQIVDRADLAAAAGVLWATWLHWCDGERDAGPRWWRPATAAALFAAALLCKENAVTLLGIVLWLDVCRGAAPEARQRLAAHQEIGGYVQRLLRNYVPLAVVLAAYLLLRGAVLGDTVRAAAQVSPLDNIIAHPEYGSHDNGNQFLARWGTPLAVFGQAARLLVWPHPLSWDYSYAAIDSVQQWGDLRLWLGIVVLIACGVVVVRSLRGRRVATPGRRWAAVNVAVGFMLVSYSVVSNTFFVIGGVFAERYLYLPSAGFCLLVAGVLGARGREGVQTRAPARASGRFLAKRSPARAALLVACLAAAIVTIVRNRDFASQAVLNAADLRAQPRSSRLWAAVGGDLLLAGSHDAALRHAEQALAIYPENATAWRVAGLAHGRLGRSEPALTALFKSVELGEGDREDTWVTIGDLLVARGEYARAIEVLELFVARRADAATALNNLAWYLLWAKPEALRDAARAVGYAERAVALQPTAGDFADTCYAALVAAGNPEKAQRMLSAALQRIPTSDPLYSQLKQKLQAPQ